MQRITIKQGDCISLQSLSSGMGGDDRFLHRFKIGQKRVEDIGLNVHVSTNALKGIKFISANPKKRALDFMDAINDEKIKAIFAIMGGFDSDRIVEFLNWDELKRNPKPLLGYSDITSLHFVFYHLGIQTFYGPTIMDGFAENVRMHQLTKHSLEKVLFTNEQQIISSSKQWTSEFLDWAHEANDTITRKMHEERHGFLTFNEPTKLVSGHLLGGCLDTIIQIKHAPFFPSIDKWKDSIIFLETSEQKMNPKKFKEALMILSEEIKVSSGIMFGKPKDETYFHAYLQIIKAFIDKPIFFIM